MAHEKFLTRCIDALDSLQDEDRRKITYIIEQVMSERREDADVALLIETGERILQRSRART